MSFAPIISTPEGSRSSIRDPKAYQIHRYRSTQAGVNLGQALPKSWLRYPVSGDHLFIDQLNGAGFIQVAFNSPSNGWIDAEEGTTLHREFTSFYVRTVSRAFQATTEAIIYSSFGPLIISRTKQYGLRANFFTAFDLVCDTTGQTLSSLIVGVPGPINAGIYRGSVMKVKNTDAANTMYFYYKAGASTPFAGFRGYPIFAGETETFALDSKLGPYIGNESVQGDNSIQDAAFATLAGTCQFALLLSVGSEMRSDPDLGVADIVTLGG